MSAVQRMDRLRPPCLARPCLARALSARTRTALNVRVDLTCQLIHMRNKSVKCLTSEKDLKSTWALEHLVRCHRTAQKHVPCFSLGLIQKVVEPLITFEFLFFNMIVFWSWGTGLTSSPAGNISTSTGGGGGGISVSISSSTKGRNFSWRPNPSGNSRVSSGPLVKAILLSITQTSRVNMCTCQQRKQDIKASRSTRPT